jgi:tetratricopeptide (TPR) repeat protein
MKVGTAGVLALALVLALGGCGQNAERNGDRVSLAQQPDELPEGVRASLDAGNASYSAGDYEAANLHYREAARLGPQIASAWFGVYMAETKLGNLREAERAMARAQELAPNMPGAHPGEGMGGTGGMPPGHPGMGELPAGHPTMTPDTPR